MPVIISMSRPKFVGGKWGHTNKNSGTPMWGRLGFDTDFHAWSEELLLGELVAVEGRMLVSTATNYLCVSLSAVWSGLSFASLSIFFFSIHELLQDKHSKQVHYHEISPSWEGEFTLVSIKPRYSVKDTHRESNLDRP